MRLFTDELVDIVSCHRRSFEILPRHFNVVSNLIFVANRQFSNPNEKGFKRSEFFGEDQPRSPLQCDFVRWHVFEGSLQTDHKGFERVLIASSEQKFLQLLFCVARSPSLEDLQNSR